MESVARSDSRSEPCEGRQGLDAGRSSDLGYNVLERCFLKMLFPHALLCHLKLMALGANLYFGSLPWFCILKQIQNDNVNTSQNCTAQP